jgi:hypothetical protein
MTETLHPDGRQTQTFDQCLTRLAEVLKAMGIEELTMEHDFHYHSINTDHPVDDIVICNFCDHVEQMYAGIVATS